MAHRIWQFPEGGWKIISAPKLTGLEAFYRGRSKRELQYQRICDFSIRLMQSRRIWLCPVPQAQVNPTLPHLATGFRADFSRSAIGSLITSYSQSFSTEMMWKQHCEIEITRQKRTSETHRWYWETIGINLSGWKPRTLTGKQVCETCNMANLGIWQEPSTGNDQGKANGFPVEAAAD